MCKYLKHYKEFEKRNIKVEKDTSQIESYFFYLKENDKPYKLKLEKKNEDKLIKSGLLDYNLIAGYEAIYSNSEIECQLSMNEYDFIYLSTKLIDDNDPQYDDYGDIINWPVNPLPPIENNFGCEISIVNASEAFATYQECKGVKCKNNIFTINISNKRIMSHDDAKTILKEIGLAALFEISTNLNLDIVLMYHQIPLLWDPLKMYDEAKSINVEPPKISKRYDFMPVNYFLNANKCSELPFYQFLQYYHCIEYYYPNDSVSHFKKVAIEEITNLNLSSPEVNAVKDALNRLFKKYKFSYNELSCLKYLFFNYLVETKIDYFIKNSPLKDYYLDIETKNWKDISKFDIIDENMSVSIDILAERIYNIRNSIVHSKEGKESLELDEINLSFFRYEIRLIKFIAEKIIIAKSE